MVNEDVTSRIIKEAIERVDAPNSSDEEFRDEEFKRCLTAVLAAVEKEANMDVMTFAKAIVALIDVSRLMATYYAKMERPKESIIEINSSGKIKKVALLKKSSQQETGEKRLKIRRTGWKERVFLLKDDKLEYYKKPKNFKEIKEFDSLSKKDLKGVIELRNATAVESTVIKGKKYLIELKTPKAKKPTYFVLAPNAEIMNDWLKAINDTCNLMSQPTIISIKEKEKEKEKSPILVDATNLGRESLTLLDRMKEPSKSSITAAVSNVVTVVKMLNAKADAHKR